MNLHLGDATRRARTWLALAAAVAVFASAPEAQRSNLPDDSMVAAAQKAWTGDLDGMITRRMIRVLVPPSKTHYFIDRGVQRGITYDALKKF